MIFINRSGRRSKFELEGKKQSQEPFQEQVHFTHLKVWSKGGEDVLH